MFCEFSRNNRMSKPRIRKCKNCEIGEHDQQN